MSDKITITNGFLFFWGGWPSQWAKAPFEVEGVGYNCCEQFMMAEKARVFGDVDALRQVLATSDPRKQKAAGRRVRNFDEATWDAVCRGVVYTGNLARFSQHRGSHTELLATESLTIVEASPTDFIWGIGLAQDDPRALDPSEWRGTNWLGIALMQVRDSLRNEGRTPEDDELRAQLKRRNGCGMVTREA
jgi:hypothetical protein